MQTQIKIKKLSPGAQVPAYQTDGSAGLDLSACIDEAITLKPGERKLVKTGLAISLPCGFEAQVRPRSGLAIKNGITALNSPGTIDSDYRGEICVILINHSTEDFVITNGMRIAQMVIAKYEHVALVAVDDLDETKRGAAGFGSTGVKA